MESDPLQKFADDNFDSVNFREIIEKYLIHWKWFVLCLLIMSVFAYVKLYFEVPQYKSSSQILITEKEKGNSLTDISSFEDIGIFGTNRSNLENEIYILSSRRLMKKVVNELKLNISYFLEKNPYDLEQFPNFPILVSFPKKKDSAYNDKKYLEYNSIDSLNVSFKVKILSKEKFEYFDSEDNSLGEYKFGAEFIASFGKKIIIDLTENIKNSLIGENIIVIITPVDTQIDYYQNNIVIETIDEESDVLNISLKGSVPEKSILIINNLIEQYNADALEDKGRIYDKTSDFLDGRIELLTNQLTAIETSAEQFKTQKGLVDVQSESGVYLQSSSINERELIEANTQLQMIDYMISELNTNTSTELLPSNIGLSNPSIINLIGEFNLLVLQRKRILKSSTDRNPLIVSLDSQLSVLFFL